MYNFVLYANVALWVVVLLIAVAMLPKKEVEKAEATAPAPTPSDIQPLEEPTTKDNTTVAP